MISMSVNSIIILIIYPSNEVFYKFLI